MKIDRVSNLSIYEGKTKNEKSPHFKPLPFDAFIPKADKKPATKEIAGILLGHFVKGCVDLNKKVTTELEIKAAIDKSEFFTNKKDAKQQILQNIEEYDTKDVIEKIRFFNKWPFCEKGSFWEYGAINYVIKNNELNIAAASELLELTGDIKRNYLGRESDRIDSWVQDFYQTACAIKNYQDFDSMTAKDKYEFIDRNLRALSKIDFDKLRQSSALCEIQLVKDIIDAGSVKKFQENLRNSMLTGGIERINVPSENTESITDLNGILSYEKLSKTLNKVNLENYKNGIPLKYSRESFINDFMGEINGLSTKDRKAVFKYFKFNIDENLKMDGYPIPTEQECETQTEAAQKAIEKCRSHVNKYMLGNETTGTGNIEFDNIINGILKAFPEYTVVIGRKTHKAESLDYHTLKVLQNVLNNPDIKELTPEEQRITVLSVLFHDFSKREAEIDKTHPLESAKYANIIIKKLNISNADKERIYTQIQHSHWLEEMNEGIINSEDVAVYFRNPDDFKIAKIIAGADVESSEYTKNEYGNVFEEYNFSQIENNIDRIHSTSSLMYNTKFPSDQSLIPRNEEGLKILDFTDTECDLGQYGFTKGLTPKDIKSYVHCPNQTGTPEKMLSLCDDKQDVVLSTTMFNDINQFFDYSVWNNSNYVLMLDCPNSNVIVGGPTVSGTGGKRGYDFVRDVMFEHERKGQISESVIMDRKIIPNILKQSLNITEEEYSELYKQIANIESSEDIPNEIVLSNGKTISKEEITNAMDELYSKLFDPVNLSIGNGYQNEICIYKPKVQAFAVKKRDFEKGKDLESVKEAAKKYDIPIVLI